MVRVDKGEFLQPRTISPKVFKFLKRISEGVPDHEKVVILTFNEFPFSNFARMTPDGYNNGEKLPSHVLIPCIRFVYDRTFHFLGSLFFYSDYREKNIDKFSKDISECMKLYILALKHVSLTVVATVSPLTDTFYGALKKLCYIPYFHEFHGALTYNVDDMWIYHIHDPAHVESRFVKLFLENDIEFSVNKVPYTASMADITECLKIDRKPLISRDPEEDLFEQTKSMGQYYLSYEVSESIERLLEMKVLPPKALGTSVFIKLFREIFEELYSNSDDAKYLILNDCAIHELINFVMNLNASEEKPSQSLKKERPKSSKLVRNLKDIDSYLTKEGSGKVEIEENAEFREKAKKLERDIYSEMCNTPDFIENNPDVVITTASGKTLSTTPGGTKKSRKKKNAPIPPDVRKELIKARIAAAEASKVTVKKQEGVSKTKIPTSPKKQTQTTPTSKSKKTKNTEDITSDKQLKNSDVCPAIQEESKKKKREPQKPKCDEMKSVDQKNNPKNIQDSEKSLETKSKRRKKSNSETLNTSQSSFDTSQNSIQEDEMKQPASSKVQSQNRTLVKKITFEDNQPADNKSKLRENAKKKAEMKADVDSTKKKDTKNKQNQDQKNVEFETTSSESSINPKKRKKSNDEYSRTVEDIELLETLIQFSSQTEAKDIEVPNLIDYELQIERQIEIERRKNVEEVLEMEDLGGGIPLTVEEFEATLLDIQADHDEDVDKIEASKTDNSSTKFESAANINEKQVGVTDMAVNLKHFALEETNTIKTTSEQEVKNESEGFSEKRVNIDKKPFPSEINDESNNDHNEADKTFDSFKSSQLYDKTGSRVEVGNDGDDTDDIPDLIEDSEPILLKMEDEGKSKEGADNDSETELPELLEDSDPIVSEMDENKKSDCDTIETQEIPTLMFNRNIIKNEIGNIQSTISSDEVKVENEFSTVIMKSENAFSENSAKSEGSQEAKNVSLTEEKQVLIEESKDPAVNKTERKYLSPIKSEDNIISPSSGTKKINKSHEDVKKSIPNEDGSDKENTDVDEKIRPEVVTAIEKFAEKFVSAQVDAEAIRGITRSISWTSDKCQNRQEFDDKSALGEEKIRKQDNAEVFVTTDLISEESMDLLVQNYLNSDQYQRILGTEAKIDTSSKFDAVVDCFRNNYEILKASLRKNSGDDKNEEPAKKEEGLIRISWKDDHTVSIEKVRADSVKLPPKDPFKITDLREIEDKTFVENAKNLRLDKVSGPSTSKADSLPKIPDDQNFGKSSVNEQVKSFIESFNKNDMPGPSSVNNCPPENARKRTYKKISHMSAKDIDEIKNWDNYHQFVNIMNTFLKTIVQFHPVLYSPDEIMERIHEDCLKLFIARRTAYNKGLNYEGVNPYKVLFDTYIREDHNNERVKCEIDAMVDLLDRLVIAEIKYNPQSEILKVENKLVRNLWLNNTVGIRRVFQALRNFDVYDELAPDLFTTTHVVKIMKHILQRGNDPYSFDFNYDCSPLDIRECFETLKPHGSVLLVE